LIKWIKEIFKPLSRHYEFDRSIKRSTEEYLAILHTKSLDLHTGNCIVYKILKYHEDYINFLTGCHLECKSEISHLKERISELEKQ
jgi:hypothetical protein